MPNRDDLQYINLMDFTAGIHNRFGTPLGHRPGHVSGEGESYDGAAQQSGTWQCYGDPKGGLRPFPRRQSVYTRTVTDIAGTSSGFVTAGTVPTGSPSANIPILDMLIMSPVVDQTTSNYATGTPDAAFFSFFYVRSTGGSPAYRQYAILRQYKRFKDTTSYYDLYNSSETIGYFGYLAYSNFMTSRASYGIEDIEDPAIRNIGLAQVRCFVSVIGSDGNTNIHNAFAYPKNALGSSPYEDDVTQGNTLNAGQNEMGFMFGHQGRTCIGFRRTQQPSGVALSDFREPFGEDGFLPIVEALGFSGVNLAFLNPEVDSEAMYDDKVTFSEENPSGYGTWASMNASELFMVKHKGGGVAVRGSVNDPQVVKLPGIESTKGMMHVPAVTPTGCYYGSRSGVWLWSGGDSSQCVSDQLDGCFWETGPYTGMRRPGIKGRFAFSHPFLYVSNDWVMDVRTGAWFRLIDHDDTTPGYNYMFYDTSWDGRVYAAPGCIDIENTALLDVFDPTILATKYQWKSQPFAATLNKDVEFQEVVLVAQGVGTVAVTLEGLEGSTQTETFTVNSPNQPVRLTLNTTCRCTDAMVTITSTYTGSVDDDSAAPIVHALHLAYRATSHIPRGVSA